MKDLGFYSQIIILLINVVSFFYLLDQRQMNFKAVRVLTLIAFTIGLIVTFGEVTWFSVLFSFAPALSLINTKADGRSFKKFRSYTWRGKQHVQGLQRDNKTLSK